MRQKHISTLCGQNLEFLNSKHKGICSCYSLSSFFVKLDNLQQNVNHNRNSATTTHTFYTITVDLTQTKFNKDQMNTLQLGLDCVVVRNPKQYLNTLIFVTENVIRHLDTHLQGIFRHLAYRKIKQIAETNT